MRPHKSEKHTNMRPMIEILAMKTHLLMTMVILQTVILLKATQSIIINGTRETIFWDQENDSQLMKHFYRIRQLRNVLKCLFKKVKKPKMQNSRISIQIRAESLRNLVEGSTKPSSINKPNKEVPISPSLKDSTHKMEMKWFSRIN